MYRLKEIYEFKDGGIAVIVYKPEPDGKELMLLHKPHFLGVMDEEHKTELLAWLIDKECGLI